MKRNQYLMILAACLMLGSNMATAELGEGLYVGGGVYHLSVDDSVSFGSLDDTTTAEAVYLGYRPIELVGVELGYYNLGDMQDHSSAGKAEFDGQALTLAGVLTFDVGFVGIYGKAGVAYLDTNSSLTLNNGYKINGDGSSSGPFAAIGASLDIWDTLYLYTEYQRIQADVDIDMVGVGLRFDF
ncbi:MAG TPA: outer membrane beta-barrel protein [Pseudomonadales bacterium]